MIRTQLAFVLASLCVSTLTAQGDPQQKQIHGTFFPQNYTQEGFVDIDSLMDTALWDAVERSLVVPPLFQAFRKQFGIRFTDLKSIRVGSVRERLGQGATMRVVTEFKTDKTVALPGLGEDRSDWNVRKQERIAGFPVVQEGRDEDPNSEFAGFFLPKLFVVPRPNVLVFGEKRTIEKILSGKARGGVPHPRLMAFTAGLRPLAYFAGKVPAWSEPDHAGPFEPFKTAWLTKDDPMTFLMLRLQIDPKTEHTVLSVTVRFTDGKKGPAKMKGGAVEAIAQAVADKRFAMLKDVLALIAFKIDDTDLVATLDLGDPKSASKVLGSVVGAFPLLMWASTSESSVAVGELVMEAEEIEEEVEEEVVDEEVEVKKAQKSDKKKADAKKGDAKKGEAKKGGKKN